MNLDDIRELFLLFFGVASAEVRREEKERVECGLYGDVRKI